jgi:hypothetical protein
MVSSGCRDMDKFGCAHSTRRTAAMASLKVGSDLAYQAVTLGRSYWAALAATPSAPRQSQPAKSITKRRRLIPQLWFAPNDALISCSNPGSRLSAGSLRRIRSRAWREPVQRDGEPSASWLREVPEPEHRSRRQSSHSGAAVGAAAVARLHLARAVWMGSSQFRARSLWRDTGDGRHPGMHLRDDPLNMCVRLGNQGGYPYGELVGCPIRPMSESPGSVIGYGTPDIVIHECFQSPLFTSSYHESQDGITASVRDGSMIVRSIHPA